MSSVQMAPSSLPSLRPERQARKRPRKRPRTKRVSWADQHPVQQPSKKRARNSASSSSRESSTALQGRLVQSLKFRQHDGVHMFSKMVRAQRRKTSGGGASGPVAKLGWQRPRLLPVSTRGLNKEVRAGESLEFGVQKQRQKSILVHPNMFTRESPAETPESLRAPNPAHRPMVFHLATPRSTASSSVSQSPSKAAAIPGNLPTTTTNPAQQQQQPPVAAPTNPSYSIPTWPQPNATPRSPVRQYPPSAPSGVAPANTTANSTAVAPAAGTAQASATNRTQHTSNNPHPVIPPLQQPPLLGGLNHGQPPQMRQPPPAQLPPHRGLPGPPASIPPAGGPPLHAPSRGYAPHPYPPHQLVQPAPGPPPPMAWHAPPHQQAASMPILLPGPQNNPQQPGRRARARRPKKEQAPATPAVQLPQGLPPPSDLLGTAPGPPSSGASKPASSSTTTTSVPLSPPRPRSVGRKRRPSRFSSAPVAPPAGLANNNHAPASLAQPVSHHNQQQQRQGGGGGGGSAYGSLAPNPAPSGSHHHQGSSSSRRRDHRDRDRDRHRDSSRRHHDSRGYRR